MIFILIILAIIFIWGIYIYNHLVVNFKNINHAKSLIDVYMKKRCDLIPMIIKVVKYEKEYEHKCLEQITKIRSSLSEESNMLEFNQIANQLLIQVESNPDLKSNNSFLELNNTLEKLENEISAARRLYNINITKYNKFRSVFPNILISKIFRYKEYEYDKYILAYEEIKF